MSTPAESYLPYGTLIGSSVTSPNSGPDSIPRLTQVNYQNVSAALEIQSNNGALLCPRLTTAQRDNLIATQGMLIYNITTGFYEVYTEGNIWEALAQGSVQGLQPFYVTAGPVQMINNAIYYLDSGGSITLTLPLASDLDDVIEINSTGSGYVIAQNAGQSIRVYPNTTTVGVGGSATSDGGSINIKHNGHIWVASPGFSGNFTIA